MNVMTAFASATRSTLAAPKLILMLWLTLLAAALPFGLMLQREIAGDIGASRVHVELRQRMDMVWLGEFQERAATLGKTLEPRTSSRADFLSNLDQLFSGKLFERPVGLVAAGVGYALVWLLLLGGVIDRFARGGGKLVAAPFLAACGRYFSRLLVLTVFSAAGYGALYWAARRLYEVLEKSTQDVTVETTVLGYYLLGALPLVLGAGLVMMIIDYARLAAVVEERGAWSALGRGARFVVRRPGSVFGLALLVTLLALGLIALRTVVLPGVGESSVLGIVAVFMIGQLFVMARLVLRVVRVGAELALYRDLR
jgi:hypothetical protein